MQAEDYSRRASANSTFAQGRKRARTIRRCGNRHPILPGDPVVYWTGIIDGEFSPWEECRECARRGWGMPWLAKYWVGA